MNIPPSATITAPNSPIPCGLYCDGSQVVKCAENLFQSNYPNLFQSGAIFNNTVSGAEVYRNTFDNLSSFATGFLGDNLQLDARCNNYEEDGATQSADAGWLVTGKLKQQGSGTGIFDIQPDNRYWPNCGQLGVFDIYNVGQSFDYFEKHQTVPGVVECVANVNVQYDLTGQNTGSGNCPLKQFLIGEDESLLSEYQNSGNALPERNRLLNAYLAMEVDETASIPDPGSTNALNLLIDRNQESDKRLLAESYLGHEDYTNAQARYQQISGSDEPTQHLKSVLAALIAAGNAGRSVSNLNQNDWAAISGLLNADDLGGSWARNIDFIRNGVYHPLSVPKPVYERQSKLAAQNRPDCTAFPNPFNNTVTFNSNEDMVEITVNDIAGKVVWISSGIHPEQVWTPDGKLPDGLYQYTIRTVSGRKLSGTIAFIRN